MQESYFSRRDFTPLQGVSRKTEAYLIGLLNNKRIERFALQTWHSICRFSIIFPGGQELDLVMNTGTRNMVDSKGALRITVSVGSFFTDPQFQVLFHEIGKRDRGFNLEEQVFQVIQEFTKSNDNSIIKCMRKGGAFEDRSGKDFVLDCCIDNVEFTFSFDLKINPADIDERIKKREMRPAIATNPEELENHKQKFIDRLMLLATRVFQKDILLLHVESYQLQLRPSK